MSSSVMPWDRPTRIIGVWPGDEELCLKYGGDQILVPPRNVVAVTAADQPGSRYRWPSARGRNGKAYPGTIEIESVTVPDPFTGGVKTPFDASDWAKGVQINQRSLFDRGFRFVADPDQIEQAMAEGRKKYDEVARKEAETWLRRHQAKRTKYRQEHGTDYVETDTEYELLGRNMEIVKRASASRPRIQDNAIAAALGQAPVAEPVMPPVRVEAPAAADDANTLAMALLSAADSEAAKAAGFKALTKAEFEGLAKRDGVVMQAVYDRLETAGVPVQIG